MPFFLLGFYLKVGKGWMQVTSFCSSWFFFAWRRGDRGSDKFWRLCLSCSCSWLYICRLFWCYLLTSCTLVGGVNYRTAHCLSSSFILLRFSRVTSSWLCSHVYSTVLLGWRVWMRSKSLVRSLPSNLHLIHWPQRLIIWSWYEYFYALSLHGSSASCWSVCLLLLYIYSATPFVLCFNFALQPMNVLWLMPLRRWWAALSSVCKSAS